MALPNALNAATQLAAPDGAAVDCFGVAWAPAWRAQVTWATLYQRAYLDAADRARRETWWRRNLPGLN